jgi:chitinase
MPRVRVRRRIESHQRGAAAAVFGAVALVAPACASPTGPASESASRTAQALVSNPHTVDYVPLWQTINSANVPWANISHINLAFAGVNSSHQCAWVDSNGNPSGYDTNASSLISYRNANYPAVKILVSVGGWTMSQYFSESMSPTYRSGFVSSCVSLVNNTGADGLDIDWEYPTRLGAGNCPSGHTCATSSDPQYLTDTLSSLRSSFGSKLITAALRGNTSGDGSNIPYQYGNFFSGSTPNLNWANVMTYDFWGTWDSTTGFTAPVGWVESALSYASSQAGGYQVDFNMGVPFYGAAWANVATSGGAGQSGTPLGTVTYRNALPLAQSSSCSVHTPSSGDTSNHYIYCPGTVSVTYTDANTGNLVTANESGVWISYDDMTVVNTKGTYVANNNWGGMMWWAQGDDSASNDLSNTIDTNMDGNTTGVSGPYNHIANQTTGYCVDGGGRTTNGWYVAQYRCSSSSNNIKWKLVSQANGTYHIVNETTGQCIDNAGQTGDGADMQQWACNDSSSNPNTHQEWTKVSVGSGWYHIVNKNSGKCLNSGGSSSNPVSQYTCGTSSNLSWSITALP